MNRVRRRDFLSTVAVMGTSALSGCLATGGPDPGDVRVENKDDKGHNIQIIATRVSENKEKAKNRTGTPTSTPISTHNLKMSVSPTNTTVESFISDVGGAFYVTIELENGAKTGTWWPLQDTGKQVAGPYLDVNISKEGEVFVFKQL